MDELLKLGTSTLCEASGLQNISFVEALRPVWRGARMAGLAWPVRCARERAARNTRASNACCNLAP